MPSALLQKTPYAGFGASPGGVLSKYQGKDLSPSVIDKEELPLTAEELARSLAERDAIGPPTVGPISIDPTDWLTPGGLAKVGATLGKGTMLVAAPIKLYHGGRNFSSWNPKTIGMGEGSFLAQGPGLYAGNKAGLAELYMKYGGSDLALLEMLVEDSNIIQASKKLSPEHKEIIKEAESRLDKLGLRASNSGIPNVFLNGRPYQKEVVREELVKSGMDGLKQDLYNDYGSEFIIFNPDIIQAIKRIK